MKLKKKSPVGIIIFNVILQIFAMNIFKVMVLDPFDLNQTFGIFWLRRFSLSKKAQVHKKS